MDSEKLQWQRAINELRFLHQEYKLVKEIAKESAPKFQRYYDTFCADRDIERGQLTKIIPDQFGVLPDRRLPSELAQQVQEADPQAAAALLEEYAQQKQIEKAIYANSEEYKMFNRLFKKIALHLHPDRAPQKSSEEERTKREEMFKEVKDALNQKRYFELLEYANQFGVEIPQNYTEQTTWLRKESGFLRDKILREKGTYNYSFSCCTTDAERSRLIKKFIKQVYGIDVD